MLPGSVHSLRFRRLWSHSAFVVSHRKNIGKSRTNPRREERKYKGRCIGLQRESKLHIPTKDPGTNLVLQMFEDEDETISRYRLQAWMCMVNAARLRGCFGGKCGSRRKYVRKLFRGSRIVNDVALRTERVFAEMEPTIKRSTDAEEGLHDLNGAKELFVYVKLDYFKRN